MSGSRSLLKEPLLHFLLLGAALFAVHHVLSRETGERPEQVVLGAGEIEHMAAVFARFQQRPPTAEELKGLIDERVREEILSREAVKLGLDRDDQIIRRRLRQKLEFVATDLAAMDEPTDAELAAWLADHQGRFREDQSFTFRHVYLDPGKRGERLESDAAALLAVLRRGDSGADTSAFGDGFLLPHEFADQPRETLGAQFGPDFAAALAELPTGQWAGPVRSGYGAHLVLVAARSEGRLPTLDEVRESVHRDLKSHRRIEANRRFLDGLLEGYDVRIEWPTQAPAGAVAGTTDQ
jgi:hypothetical protein